MKKEIFPEYYLESKLNITNHGLILNNPNIYTEGQKDPSIVYDEIRKVWHIYFTYCGEQLRIGHLISENLPGP